MHSVMVRCNQVYMDVSVVGTPSAFVKAMPSIGKFISFKHAFGLKTGSSVDASSSVVLSLKLCEPNMVFIRKPTIHD